MERCCGACKWLEQVAPYYSNPPRCMYPLPYWIEKFAPHPLSGVDCPCFERKEA